MPLHVPPAPAAAHRSVVTALGSPTAVHGRRTPPALRAAAGPVRAEFPLPLHVLDRITDAAGPARTRLTAWRFLLRDESTTVGAADAMLTADGWAFSHFCDGPYVASSERALEQADLLAPDVQPRLLSVPELYMLTLWLHQDTEADPAEGSPAPTDLLVPLAPAPPGIAAYQPHQVQQLLPVLTHRLSPAPLLGTPA